MNESRFKTINEIWSHDPNRGIPGTERRTTFDELASSIVTLGPFYYYVIDFSDRSLDQISDSFKEILGISPESATLAHILEAIHPEDFGLVGELEMACSRFFTQNIAPEKFMRYKTSFNFRIRTKSGEYALFNHQSLMLSVAPDGGYGRAINIHTRIDHLTEVNNGNFSIIGLDSEPSYLNVPMGENLAEALHFSNKEIEVIRYLSDGMDSHEIAARLFISPHTVKTHRRNILGKSGCRNVAHLIKMCVMQGLV